MSDPLDGLTKIWPEKTHYLGQVFNDTAASYKFFWLIGLLSLIQRHGKAIYSLDQVVEEMVVAAWHPVCFYRLSLGAQDKLQDTVRAVRDSAELANDASPDDIRPEVQAAASVRASIQKLTSLVPTRFLSPWFAELLRGEDGNARTTHIQQLADESQRSSSPSPYFFEMIRGEKHIHLSASWMAFFTENAELIRSFVYFHLCRYLQSRNPNVPGIVNKLTAPIHRDLTSARQFWRAVRSEFQNNGKNHLFEDIYAGTPLDDSFSIDHFLPWSFVAHDLLWNLTPVTGVTNSKKGDTLPNQNIYLPRLSRLHREALTVLSTRPRLIEDYTSWFMTNLSGLLTLSENQFLNKYRELYEPQFQIAINQGFQANWQFL